MLRLFIVFGHFNDDLDSEFSHLILGYSECHAVNLFYRFYDLKGQLNDVTHHRVQELEVIHPNHFKSL